MKCPNCGAETNKPVCEYCGTEIHNPQACCKRCGSTNLSFRRENQGETKVKKANQIIHKTVGICKDCGYTWFEGETAPKKRKTWLWVLGWIFVFPVPLTILLLRKKEMKPFLKYGIIAVAWIAYLLIVFLSGRSNANSTTQMDSSVVPTVISSSNATFEPSMETESADSIHSENTLQVTDHPEELSNTNKNYIEKNQSSIVAVAKMSLDRFITDYEMSLAPQLWTLAKFDETDTVIALTDITYKGITGKYIYVGTLEFDDSGKVISATPHYLEVNGSVLGNDGYCDDVFDTIKHLTND